MSCNWFHLNLKPGWTLRDGVNSLISSILYTKHCIFNHVYLWQSWANHFLTVCLKLFSECRQKYQDVSNLHGDIKYNLLLKKLSVSLCWNTPPPPTQCTLPCIGLSILKVSYNVCNSLIVFFYFILFQCCLNNALKCLQPFHT